MVDVLNGDLDYFFTPTVVHLRFLSLFVGSIPPKTSRQDFSTRIHSLVPLSREEINDKDVLDDLIPA